MVWCSLLAPFCTISWWELGCLWSLFSLVCNVFFMVVSSLTFLFLIVCHVCWEWLSFLFVWFEIFQVLFICSLTHCINVWKFSAITSSNYFSLSFFHSLSRICTPVYTHRHTYVHMHTKTRAGESLWSVVKLSLCIAFFVISALLLPSLLISSSVLPSVSFSAYWRASSFLTFFLTFSCGLKKIVSNFFHNF